jgi:hypothetical protein
MADGDKKKESDRKKKSVMDNEIEEESVKRGSEIKSKI